VVLEAANSIGDEVALAEKSEMSVGDLVLELGGWTSLGKAVGTVHSSGVGTN